MNTDAKVLWMTAALALLAALFALDLLTGDGVLLAAMFAAAPALAALGAGPALTGAVGVAAVACALISGLVIDEGLGRQDVVRTVTVALVGNLAVWAALVRERMVTSTAEATAQERRYSTLLRALSEAGEGLVVLREERAVYVNDAFAELTGLSREQLLARPSLFDLIEPDERDEARRRMRARIEKGIVDPEYRLRLRRADGSLLDVEVSGVPLQTADGPQLVVVVRDVSERVRAFRRLAFLAEASEVFDENLDEEPTLQRIARVCVSDYARTCVIVLTEPGQEPRRVAALARDPARQRLLDEYYESDTPVRLDPRNPMVRVAQTGEPAVVLDVPDAVRRAGGSEESAEFARRLGTPTAVIVPLSARGRSHGSMSLGFAELTAEQADRMVELFEDVAGRAALAIDNARLYGERAHVARTLQRSLLPSELPEVPGVELAARYAAAGEGNEVGGDFYDCFAGLGTEWVAVIGDVCGKGPEAAAITALTRYTLRTSVLHGGGPVEALSELNEVLLRQQLDHRFCTVLCVMLEPREDRMLVRLASGGHPLPVLARRSGTTEQVGRPGTLLGVLPYPRLCEDEVELGPGDSLIMYTDGVTEASPLDDAFGPERLADFVARLGERPAAEIAAFIEAEALRLQDGVARDDVAVLVARRLPPTQVG